MAIRKFDYNLLVIFEAVMKERSVSAAADAVGLTQPAVSASLGRLRQIVGDPLFIRTNRGMEPTERAIALGGTVIKSLEDIRQSILQPATFSPATSKRTFSILLQEVGEVVFLPTLVTHLEHHAPGINISIPAVDPHSHAEALLTGTTDLAVGYFPHLRASFHHSPLLEVTFSCLIRANHARIRKRLSMRQFLSARHVVVARQGSAVLDKILSRRGITLDSVVRVGRFTAVPAIISQTDMIAIMPSTLASTYARGGSFRALPLPFPSPTIEIQQYWHRRNQHDHGVSWLRNVLDHLFKK